MRPLLPTAVGPAFPLPTTFGRSAEHQRRAHDRIPGAAHTYAKGDDQYPENMAPVIARGDGCYVWDLDGNRYVEFGSGVRAVTLGHNYRPVVEAAAAAMRLGTNFVRPHELELAAAEAMLSVCPGAERVKFAKNGSDATTAAVRLARAATGRDLVALCSDQPFFSVDDWFVCTTPMDAGTSLGSRSATLTFKFNDLGDLKRLFDAHPKRVACVIMEAERDEPPAPGYLAAVKELCRREGAVLVFDEVVAGFRLHAGGGQSLHGVTPDLSTWGKGMANGFAIAALMGRADLMDLGGTRDTGRDRVFLLSTTNGGETHALAACIATVETYCERDVVGHLRAVGEQLRDGFAQIAASLGIARHLHTAGHPSNLVFVTKDADGNRSQPFRTLFMQELVRRGVLAPSLVVSDAMGPRDVAHTLWAIAEAAAVYKRALADGVGRYLEGRPVQPVFRKRS